MDESTLVITLGGQAQVVTFALDCCWTRESGWKRRLCCTCRREMTVTIGLWPSCWPNSAVTATGTGHCRLRLVPLRPRGKRRQADGHSDEADAEAAWQTAYRLVASLKEQGPPAAAVRGRRPAHDGPAHHERGYAALRPPGHDLAYVHPADFLEQATGPGLFCTPGRRTR